ncbi:uncharacterized protein CEXT_740621 [Caerostris extrusa]|uniref:Uncharacterized protein n=1 Tax=Caerostris extrusa TaxID=172846 RepID=A0AAV4N9C2_CAEEX|nr:uncharacterized protein CEXT_740621 [Caerostris extrusa]
MSSNETIFKLGADGHKIHVSSSLNRPFYSDKASINLAWCDGVEYYLLRQKVVLGCSDVRFLQHDISKINCSLQELTTEQLITKRTCKSATIEPHWCACLSWYELPTTDALAHMVAQAVLIFMNKLTQSQRAKCEELRLSKVMRLEKFVPNKDFLAFKQNADLDGRAGEFSDNTRVTEILYQVQIETYPSEGIYESIVKYNVEDKKYHVKEEEISRVNMYGNQEHCIHDEFPELRKYCYCKIQLQE